MKVNKSIIIGILAAIMILAGTDASLAQGKLSFDKTVHDFGDIQIADGEVSCTFPFKNTGTEAVVIHEVVTSCGCTTPKYPRSPILPGASGEVEVTFTNNQGPYAFDKSITVYHSASKKPIVLHIKGTAHEKKKTIDELFPMTIGGVGFRKSGFSGGYVNQGGQKSGEIDIANTTNKKMEIVFTDVTPGLTLKVSPSTISPKSKATIKYTITADAADDRWGNVSYFANVAANGAKPGQIRIDACILDNFDKLSKADLKNAPLPYFKNSVYEYGKVQVGSDVKCTFHMTNKGKSTLLVHRIQGAENIDIITPVPFEVPADGQADIVVMLRNVQGNGDTLFDVTMICNSPSRPMVNLFMSGIVKDMK